MTRNTDISNQIQLPDKTIVLVGLMGAGKSCVGRRIAQQLDIPFLDADAEVEAAAGCSIVDIFERYGEDEFRDGERRVIARLLDGPPSVIATGGGAFIDQQTRKLIHENGLSVWLRADLDTLVVRTAGRTHRPLLNSGDQREILSNLIEQRYPIYAEADITVETGSDSANVTCNRVLDAIEAHETALAKAKAT
ncbi:MAG: shikimate kinase [Rhodospirillaceae bacterium]